MDNIYSLSGSSSSPKHIEDVSQKVAKKLVKDVTRHTVTTVKEETPVGEVVQLMLSRGVHRVPVMREEHIVGIVTQHDFLKLIASD